MSAEFITTEYEWAHGKKPRGIGSWAFVPSEYIWRSTTMPADAVAWAWGTYTDAKREVARKYPTIERWVVLS